MTNLQAIKNQVKQISRQLHPPKFVCVYGDEPIPPHHPNDIIVKFKDERMRYL